MSLKEEMAEKAQFYPGETDIAENRRNYMNPNYELEKLREIADEDVVRLMGHREPGEEYPSVHPPLEEMEEPECPIRELVEPTDGAKQGDRIRYIQFTDSVYFAPIHPYIRARMYMWRYRGVDTGTLSGRQIIEVRERDLEKIAKELLETEIFDPARTGVRGATVHGHSLRLDENGLMFDALRRYRLNEEKGVVEYVKDQVGIELDEPIEVGAPADEEDLKERTTIYRIDGVPFREDEELLQVIQRIHELRTLAGYNPKEAEGK
jgi:methyl-coenzyme M reductase gamma subunit